jgi:hypothetical protein
MSTIEKSQKSLHTWNKSLLIPAISLLLALVTVIFMGCSGSIGDQTKEPPAQVVVETRPTVNAEAVAASVTSEKTEIVLYLPEKEGKLGKKLVKWLGENDFTEVTIDVLDSVKPSQTTILYRANGRDVADRLGELLAVKEMQEWKDGDPNVTICVIPGDDFDDLNLFANPALPDGDMSVLNQRSAPLDDPVVSADDAKPDGIYISLVRCALSLYAGGELKGTWQCSVGLPSRATPRGKFRVVSMIKNPDWSWQGRIIPPGPKNGLGSRFLGISKPSYGIHGTNNPDSIGKALSHGCVRMHNRDVEALYDMVEVGTPVTIGD